MNTTVKTMLGMIAVCSFANAGLAQELSIDNWQEGFRAEGLGNQHRLMPNLMVVNGQDVFALNYQARDYDLHEIPSVARVMNHPAVSGFVVITEKGDVLLEHYRNGEDRNSSFSDQYNGKFHFRNTTLTKEEKEEQPMKKSTFAIALTAILAISGSVTAIAQEESSQTGRNGVKINLTGDFYHPNETQVLQEKTPVIKFAGLNEQGGKDIVAAYIAEFGENVFAEAIKDKLVQLDDGLKTEQLADILKTKQDMIKHFPNVVKFYSGIADATGFTDDEVYMAAWASDGMFAYDIQAIVKDALPKLKKATESNRGCTAIAWNNGIMGQNQDMPIALGGHGAIWKSGKIIVHAPEPFFMGIAMTKSVGCTINTIDTFNLGDLEDGMPLSGVSLGLLSKFDNAWDIAKYMDGIKINSAPAYQLSDTSGNALTVEAKRGINVVIDGSRKGYVVHANHPVGLEEVLVNRHANGNAKAFDSVVAQTTWRQAHAEAFAKYSPYQTVAALQDVFSQKPLQKAPYKGNGFVSVNTIIHDLNNGCTYGTTWMSTMQDFTKVSFD